jgi:hypothetical protein
MRHEIESSRATVSGYAAGELPAIKNPYSCISNPAFTTRIIYTAMRHVTGLSDVFPYYLTLSVPN